LRATKIMPPMTTSSIMARDGDGLAVSTGRAYFAPIAREWLRPFRATQRSGIQWPVEETAAVSQSFDFASLGLRGKSRTPEIKIRPRRAKVASGSHGLVHSDR
jgi:hypothetical protein